MKTVAKALQSHFDNLSQEHVAKINLNELCQTFEADTAHLSNLIRSICTTAWQDQANTIINPQ